MDLSCPSSSASSYASTYVQRYVLSALGSAGFSKSSGQAVNLLSEVFERYLLLLGNSTQELAGHVGRTEATAWDAEEALQRLGSSSEQIRAWLLEDGVDVAGEFHIAEADKQAIIASGIGEEDEEAGGEDGGISLLERFTQHGKSRVRDRAPLQLFYENVSVDQERLLRELFEQDEIEDDASEHSSRPSSQTPPPPYPGSPADADDGKQTAFKRKRSPSDDRLFPSFLPPLPSFPNSSNGVDATGRSIHDAEYERELSTRIQKGEERSKVKEQPVEELQTDAQASIEDLASLPKRSADDLWQRAIPFQSSSLAAVQSANDLPAIEESMFHEVALAEMEKARITSSMRAFANDYPALVREARATPAGLLTPSGAAFAQMFHKRRNLAAFLTDSSKYTPSDTVFGSISARPTVLPFQPTGSMLVTPPTADNPAPTFTPLRPDGRDIPSTSVANNALYPTCRHRNPGNVTNAARLLAGGVGTETYRRSTRIHDPEPILDEQHAERVFHGQPAPKELLIEDNSVLKGALDMLKIRRMEERAATREALGLPAIAADGADLTDQGGLDENGKPTGQLSMSATRDRIKVKSGTIVSTWDWISRDHTDPVVTGKKFRAGTAGIGLSGDVGTDTTTMTDETPSTKARERSFSNARSRSQSISRHPS